MKIRYSKKFVKPLAKFPPKVDKALKTRMKLFQDDIHHPLLHTHSLQGDFKGFYSINITGDIRALYEVIGDDIYLYDMIGTHSQPYGK